MLTSPPKQNINIDSLIKSFEKDAGFFIVLLGVERKKEEIVKYLIALFDSSFYGQKKRPEILFRSQKYEEGPMFYFDGLYTVDFHNDNDFFYSSLETDKNLNQEKYVKDFYKDIQVKLNEDFGCSMSEEEVDEVINEMWVNGGEEIKTVLKEMDACPFLMPFGRMNEQLLQVQMNRKQFREMYGESESVKTQEPLFTLMQKLFPSEKINNYCQINRKFVLPEHKKMVFPDIY